MKTSGNFTFQITKKGAELLVSVQGDLDMYTVSTLQDKVWDQLTPDITIVIFDCNWVRYVDSTFLQFITRLNSQIDSVKIINASRTVKTIFDITGLSFFLSPS